MIRSPKDSKHSPIEIGALVASVVILIVVVMKLPANPSYPKATDFRNPDFNPFQGNPRYRPPSCEETAYPWDSNARQYRKCPAKDPDLTTEYATVNLRCTDDRVSDEEFFQPLNSENRVQWVNFTGPVTGQIVSAMVVLPEKRLETMRMPVVYALHARDQAYEKMVAAGNHIDMPIEKLHVSFKGWVQDMMCELNNPKMEPHILVIPLRGGDRMWIDCHDLSACALETQITQELVPHIDSHYNTLATPENRGCIGYSMGASGCLNLATKFPKLFGTVVVQSPGVWPRFVTWDELVETEGQQESPFSTRSFLLDKVFDGKSDYESKNTCRMLESKMRANDDLRTYRPKFRVWFGMRDPFIQQDEDLFGCFACNQMCQQFNIVVECTHSDFFRCLSSESTKHDDYLKDLVSIFKR